jgi:coenzyme Q-binding protein COQ10
MPRFSTDHRVAHSADDMFALVAEVEAYPQFVPLCERLTVRRRSQEGTSELLVADMTVGYKAIRETFATRVVLDRPARTIVADYLDGPFKHLHSVWTFRPAGEHACVVGFSIDYEFKSRMLSMVMGGVFDRAFRKFSTAFEERADRVYGATLV